CSNTASTWKACAWNSRSVVTVLQRGVRFLFSLRLCTSALKDMENLAIARIFSEIADLLEIKNENPFKIRAYRNAADTIVHAAGQLSACSNEQLRAMAGIGKDLAAKIREICETGDTEYHRDLLQEFPPTILDLLHLQGVGPKTV